MTPRPSAGIYLEVFNGLRAIRDRETWSIHYEQCNYFGTDTLASVVRAAGYDVLEASTCYGGDQYVYVDAHRGHDDSPGVLPRSTVDSLPLEITRFADAHRQALEQWSARLDRFRHEGRRVVIWGTGGKGISFLNTLDTADVVAYAVDINPDRQGMFTPGTAHPVVEPARLQQDRPDVVIITNGLYEREIVRQVDELGVTAECVVA